MPLAPSRHYPPTRKGDWVEDFHGTSVADPYRWLEDPNSPETQVWVAAQNELTFSFLHAIPARERIKARLTELWDYPKYGGARKEGDRYFFFKNEGLQNQSVLYMLRSLDGEPVAILDPEHIQRRRHGRVDERRMEQGRNDAGVCHLEQRERLAGGSCARCRWHANVRRPCALVQVYRDRLASRWERFLLQPFPRAGRYAQCRSDDP